MAQILTVAKMNNMLDEKWAKCLNDDGCYNDNWLEDLYDLLFVEMDREKAHSIIDFIHRHLKATQG